MLEIRDIVRLILWLAEVWTKRLLILPPEDAFMQNLEIRVRATVEQNKKTKRMFDSKLNPSVHPMTPIHKIET